MAKNIILGASVKDKSGWSSPVWDKVLSIVLVLAILSALVMLGYVIANPKPGERFVEFYLLGLSAKAEGYPRELKVGEEGKAMVGIVNREQEGVTYRVEVRIDGVKNNEVGPLSLVPDEKWEKIVSFTPDRAGEKQKVEFLLSAEGRNKAYPSLYLLVDVR